MTGLTLSCIEISHLSFSHKGIKHSCEMVKDPSMLLKSTVYDFFAQNHHFQFYKVYSVKRMEESPVSVLFYSLVEIRKNLDSQGKKATPPFGLLSSQQHKLRFYLPS